MLHTTHRHFYGDVLLKYLFVFSLNNFWSSFLSHATISASSFSLIFTNPYLLMHVSYVSSRTLLPLVSTYYDQLWCICKGMLPIHILYAADHVTASIDPYLQLEAIMFATLLDCIYIDYVVYFMLILCYFSC